MADFGCSFFCITDYGAVPGGETDCTAAIQAAVDTAEASGGGYVTIPAGIFLSGTIWLKSHVFLLLTPGSTLLGSLNAEDFQHPKLRCSSCTAFLLAEEAENCGVTGQGTIDLRRQDIGWTKEHGRPCILLLSRCRNVEVSGITLLHTGFFNIYACGCDGCRFTGLIIDSTGCENGDGIDVSGSRNITISDCRISTGDDAIGLKTHIPEEPCENITITNCILTTEWGGIRLGPESCGDFRHITVSNCVFVGCSDGVKLQLCDSYNMEDLTFSNLNMRQVRRPVFFTSSSCPMSGRSKSVRPLPGRFRRILVSDVLAECAQRTGNWFESVSVITGIPGHPIEDVTLRNFHIVFPGGEARKGGIEVPELLDHHFYPDLFYVDPCFPSACLFLRNASCIRIDTAVFEAEENDVRPALVAESVCGLTLLGAEERNCGGLIRHTEVSSLRLKDCTGESLTLSKEQRIVWDAFRERSKEEDILTAENARLLDLCTRLPVLAVHKICGEVKTDLDLPCESHYLILSRSHGPVELTADGEKTIYSRDRAEPYDFGNDLAIPLPGHIRKVSLTTKFSDNGKITFK